MGRAGLGCPGPKAKEPDPKARPKCNPNVRPQAVAIKPRIRGSDTFQYERGGKWIIAASQDQSRHWRAFATRKSLSTWTFFDVFSSSG